MTMLLSRRFLFYILFLGLTWLPLSSAQIPTRLSASSNTIAYVVNTEDGSEPSPVIWDNDQFRVTTTELELTTLVAAISGEVTEIPYGCSLDDIVVYTAMNKTTDYPAAETCFSGCVAVDVIETWPSHSNTWTLYKCMEDLKNIDRSSMTLYRVVPPITTSESSSTESSSRTPTTTQSTSTSTRGNDGDSDGNDRDNSDDGPSTGVIVGAVVGSVGAVALIAIAFWLGIRHARRQSVSTVGTDTVSGAAGYRDTMSTAPGHASSVAWTHSSPSQMYSPPLDGANQQQYKASSTPVPHAVQDDFRMYGLSPRGELSSVPLSDPTLYEVSATPRP